MKKLLKPAISLFSLIAIVSCKKDEGESFEENKETILYNHSVTPNLLKVDSEFRDVEIYSLLSSEDKLFDSEGDTFTYGSMADGNGLLKNDDGTYSLINNIEADYSVARIKFDETFKPVMGDYILNATATSSTAQCSGTLVTFEEHGFGPTYLSGGEWGGESAIQGVYEVNPSANPSDRSIGKRLNALGQWTVENAVPLSKDAYKGKTVVMIGDDQSNNEIPSGHLGMYVGPRGDLSSGKLYALKVTSSGIDYEMDMVEGTDYDVEFVEVSEREKDALDTECKEKGAIGFSRVEDIDWRRGSSANNREVYFVATGRKKDGLVGKGTLYGRIYKLTMNQDDPTKAGKLTCILDGDKDGGIADMFHSPDNITVTSNYAYIQEDPNGYFDGKHDHFARLYQYNLKTKVLKTVLECNQDLGASLGYGTTSKSWEITGMTDVSDVIGVKNSFLLITQNHGWESDTPFTDPKANTVEGSRAEGSHLYLIKGLER